MLFRAHLPYVLALFSLQALAPVAVNVKYSWVSVTQQACPDCVHLGVYLSVCLHDSMHIVCDPQLHQFPYGLILHITLQL